MKILLVNEYIKGGGAEKIFDLQYELLTKNDHAVSRLVFGYANKGISVKEQEKAGYHMLEIPFYKKIIKSRKVIKKIKELVDNINPDIIIVHNVFSSPISVYSGFENRKTIVIVHDGYLVCPTSKCVYNEDSHKLCRGYKHSSCLKHCMHNYGISLLLKLYMLRRLEKETRKAVDIFVSPSRFFAETLAASGYRTCVINNPVDKIERLDLSRKRKDGYIHFLYLGGLVKNKGIYMLMEAIEQLAESEVHKQIRIDLFGGIEDETILNVYKEFEKAYSFIRYHGMKEHGTIMHIMEEYDYLIVPSVCSENYPTVALEAMSRGTVVIGADIGGIPEILEGERGILYDYRRSNDLAEKMKEAAASSWETYKNMAQKVWEYVRTNNAKEEYYRKLMECISQLQSPAYN